MIAIIQRVKEASVSVSGELIGAVGIGLMILLGVVEGDTQADADWLARKCVAMRIFPDEAGVMNRSVLQAGGRALAVSQFTLAADIRKGNRPSYIRAMRPPESENLYEYFCNCLRALGLEVEQGRFGADMDVSLINWGPVTIIADSRQRIGM